MVDLAKRGQDDDGKRGLGVTEPGQDIESAQPRKHHVEHNEIDLLLKRALETAVAVQSRDHLEALGG